MPGSSENERMRKMLEEMLAALDRDSASRSQENAASQASFAETLDQRILGEEQSDADNLVRQQRERQLPMERQAFDAGRADGSSRDELANYAMIRRGQRGTSGKVSPRAEPMDDAAGFERDFQKDQASRERLTDMFGSKSRVPEGERQRILSELSRAGAATVAGIENAKGATAPPPPRAAQLDIRPPTYPEVSYPVPNSPGREALDEAALRERAAR